MDAFVAIIHTAYNGKKRGVRYDIARYQWDHAPSLVEQRTAVHEVWRRLTGNDEGRIRYSLVELMIVDMRGCDNLGNLKPGKDTLHLHSHYWLPKGRKFMADYIRRGMMVSLHGGMYGRVVRRNYRAEKFLIHPEQGADYWVSIGEVVNVITNRGYTEVHFTREQAALHNYRAEENKGMRVIPADRIQP